MDVYTKQIRAFRRKFGREMRPDDPFFFDPDMPTPQFRRPAEAQQAIALLVELMAEAGMDPEAIYAFKATDGLFPSEQAPFTPEQEAAWNAAIHEYQEKLHRTKPQ
jgi:hypothetical protein